MPWEKCERPEFDSEHTCLVHLTVSMLEMGTDDEWEDGLEYEWFQVFHDLREQFGEEAGNWEFPSRDFDCWDIDEDSNLILTLMVKGGCQFCQEEEERRKIEESRKAFFKGEQGALAL